MNCPYCQEDIKDQAIICRFCQRDLLFLRPMTAKISGLEERVETLALVIEGLSTDPRSSPEGTIRLRNVSLTVAAMLSFLLSFAFYWLSWQAIVGNRFGVLWNFISAASPFAGALWLGWNTPKVRLATCIVMGFVVGLADYLQFFFVFHSNAFMFDRLFFLLNGSSYTKDLPLKNYPVFLATYVVSGLCLFPAGYALAARLRKRAAGSETGISLASTKSGSLIAMATTLSPILVAFLGIISSIISSILAALLKNSK